MVVEGAAQAPTEHVLPDQLAALAAGFLLQGGAAASAAADAAMQMDPLAVVCSARKGLYRLAAGSRSDGSSTQSWVGLEWPPKRRNRVWPCRR